MVIKWIFLRFLTILFGCVVVLSACSRDNAWSKVDNDFRPKKISYSFIYDNGYSAFCCNKKIGFENKYVAFDDDESYKLILDFLLSNGEVSSPFEEIPPNQKPVLYIEYLDNEGNTYFLILVLIGLVQVEKIYLTSRRTLCTMYLVQR